MSMRYLGPSFDIHTGGIDLVFPHHEDEIAQSEAATGQPFVRTWLHCAHLQMGGEKMAKRTGNIARPAELYAERRRPRALRYALLAAHYRAPLEFSDESLAAAAAAVERLSTVLAALDAYREDARRRRVARRRCWREARARVRGRRWTTTSTSRRRWRAVFDLVRELNRRMAERALSTADAAPGGRRAAGPRPRAGGRRGGRARQLAAGGRRALLEERAAARAARDWARSDALRDELASAASRSRTPATASAGGGWSGADGQA